MEIKINLGFFHLFLGLLCFEDKRHFTLLSFWVSVHVLSFQKSLGIELGKYIRKTYPQLDGFWLIDVDLSRGLWYLDRFKLGWKMQYSKTYCFRLSRKGWEELGMKGEKEKDFGLYFEPAFRRKEKTEEVTEE